MQHFVFPLLLLQVSTLNRYLYPMQRCIDTSLHSKLRKKIKPRKAVVKLLYLCLGNVSSKQNQSKYPERYLRKHWQCLDWTCHWTNYKVQSIKVNTATLNFKYLVLKGIQSLRQAITYCRKWDSTCVLWTFFLSRTYIYFISDQKLCSAAAISSIPFFFLSYWGFQEGI